MEGLFPDMLKVPKVITIFKSVERNQAVKYSPISVTPILKKVFETIMKSQLSINYFNNKKTIEFPLPSIYLINCYCALSHNR